MTTPCPDGKSPARRTSRSSPQCLRRRAVVETSTPTELAVASVSSFGAGFLLHLRRPDPPQRRRRRRGTWGLPALAASSSAGVAASASRPICRVPPPRRCGPWRRRAPNRGRGPERPCRPWPRGGARCPGGRRADQRVLVGQGRFDRRGRRLARGPALPKLCAAASRMAGSPSLRAAVSGGTASA